MEQIITWGEVHPLHIHSTKKRGRGLRVVIGYPPLDYSSLYDALEPVEKCFSYAYHHHGSQARCNLELRIGLRFFSKNEYSDTVKIRTNKGIH